MGALSNPRVELEIQDSTKRVSGLLAKTSSEIKPAAVKPRPGEIYQTVYEVLSGSVGAMRAKEIHLACEQRLGHPIVWGTIKQCLSANSMGPNSKYLRVGHGRYVLRPSLTR